MRLIKGKVLNSSDFFCEKAGFMSALMVLLGIIAAYFLIKSRVMELIAATELCGLFSVVCILLLVFISGCGLCVAGAPIVFLLDFAFGAFASALAYISLADTPLSTLWLLWSVLLLFGVLSALTASSAACRLSGLLLHRVCADIKLKRRLLGYAVFSLVFILVIVSVLILNADLIRSF